MAKPKGKEACTRTADDPVQLDTLAHGKSARLHAAELACEDCDMLQALGLTDRCRLRVCKTGNPVIVQVRQTRIGLARSVAERLLVVPEGD